MNFSFKTAFSLTAMTSLFLAVATCARADVVELTNGDHYRGTVLGMTLTNLDFLSEIQGRVKLPRDKVAQITLHEVTPKPVAGKAAQIPIANSPATAVSGSPNSNAPVTGDAVLQQLRTQGVDPKLISQVQEQIFGKGSPEAAQKFNEMMGGLMSGSLSVKDIRAQAQDSIKQIQAAKKDLGPDAGDMLDGYLAVLEKFVQESGDNATPAAPDKPLTK